MRHSASFLIPFSLITLYYVFWIGLMVILLTLAPGIIRFFPIGGLNEIVNSGPSLLNSVARPDSGSAFIAIGPLKLVCASIGAAVMIIPVSWVYFITSRSKEISQSLVQTIIVMPIVVTGVSMIVMNSVALAFSLAGIVAAVRFRFALREPAHAMYIFTAIGIGLGAGIGALDIATVISAAFVYASLIIWRLEYGKILSGPFLSMLSRRNRGEENI